MYRKIVLLSLQMLFAGLCARASHATSAVDTLVFSLLNLTVQDADSLVLYYRDRQSNPSQAVVFPGFDVSAAPSATERHRADEALEHRFFVHDGYQPSYFYGKDIDWQYWPVKDNELRWQLHRMKWWTPMGKMYRYTRDERYAREWTLQYVDWIRKNPLGEYGTAGDRDMFHADNRYFAWRPLEASHRIMDQIRQFLLFLPSERIDGAFISQFLINYHRHCEHIRTHFSATGNHLLFEAQRLLAASLFFPEFKDAPLWRTTALDILCSEIEKQVYADGVQFELDPFYHSLCIDIFLDALDMAEANGQQNLFPARYTDRLHKMMEVTCNMAFPDATLPAFSDFHGQPDLKARFARWSKTFPDDSLLLYLASDGDRGALPKEASRAFPIGGFYCLRTGWDQQASVLILKGGPAGEWHCQPDNGTFEYWRKGRNFFPDSGGYVYGGDAAIQAQRDWFRQTAVHNTLTLDGRNIETADTKLRFWQTSRTRSVCIIENPSYPGLVHRRRVELRADGTVLIEDRVSGSTEGEVGLHYQLLPCAPVENLQNYEVRTNFADGNDISLQITAPKEAVMTRQEGQVSFAYKQSEPRPAYCLRVWKQTGKSLKFKTIIKPL